MAPGVGSTGSGVVLCDSVFVDYTGTATHSGRSLDHN